MAERDLIRIGEVMRLLGVTRRTIYDWCEAGTLPHYRYGCTYRFDRAEIVAWRDARHVAGGDETDG